MSPGSVGVSVEWGIAGGARLKGKADRWMHVSECRITFILLFIDEIHHTDTPVRDGVAKSGNPGNGLHRPFFIIFLN
jgi:hypothetical protein